MASRKAVDEEARQPLLSDTDHDQHVQTEEQQAGNLHTGDANTKDTDSWHWLERLVFKTRRRFFVSFSLLLVFWMLVAFFTTDIEVPWRARRWPWTKEPDYISDGEFWNAFSRLEEQPFCRPSLELLKFSDVRLDEDIDRSDEAGCETTCTKSWHFYLFERIAQGLDRLAGTTVRGPARRRREAVHTLMSIIEGEPFYNHTARAPSAHPPAPTPETFQSPRLWTALKKLSLQVKRQHGEAIPLDDLLVALHMNNSRVLVEPSRDGHGSPGQHVLQTTLLDTQTFVQSLAALYYGCAQTSPKSSLDRRVVRNYLASSALTQDGTMTRTYSAFNVVTRKSHSGWGSALTAVDRLEDSSRSMQRTGRPIHHHVLNEMHDNHELSISLDLERGLIVTALAHLAPLSGEELIRDTHPQNGWPHKLNKNVWDWMRNSIDTIEYDVDMRQAKRRLLSVGGTYRYQRQISADKFDWVEVDIQMAERALWITRLEYAPAANSSWPASNDTHPSASPVSVLRKYNAGGTADFLAGWTCQYETENLANCYRPYVADDDRQCLCKEHRSDEVSSYRVGLWPRSTNNQHSFYEIPPGAIRSDTNSYMDQAEGGCPALWDRTNWESVPEMEAFGYMIKLTEPEISTNGTIAREAQLEWLENGLTLTRVRTPKLRW